MIGWYMTGPTRIDGSAHPENGVATRFDGAFVPMKTGLYACEDILDCLLFARGSTICSVALGDIVQKWPDKIAGRERTILWRIDGGRVLRDFAHWCAERCQSIAEIDPEQASDSHREAARVPGADAPWLQRDASWWAARDAAFAASWDLGPDAAACRPVVALEPRERVAHPERHYLALDGARGARVALYDGQAR